MALDALIAGVAGESFSVDPQLIMRAVFKDGSGAKQARAQAATEKLARPDSGIEG
jgi:hypothetical protein